MKTRGINFGRWPTFGTGHGYRWLYYLYFYALCYEYGRCRRSGIGARRYKSS